ncbi:MAG: HD domain-containing protein [bacterium]
MNNLIREKLFRVQENENKIHFILANTSISEGTLVKGAVVARKNPYHNYGHALGATEYAIKLAIAEGLTPQEINILGLSMIFHDAGHRGRVHLYDEMRAVQLADEILDLSDTQCVHGYTRESVTQNMRNLILDTMFPDARGQKLNPLARIVQDADLAHLGQGPEYWVWASMGLIEEFNLNRLHPLTPQDFIVDEQEKFVNFLAKLSGSGDVYLSAGAKKIFRNPLEDVLAVKKYSLQAIEYAYNVRYEDVTLDEFKKQLLQFA